MACYCQYCRFIYPAGVPNCYTCGRPTTRDNLSIQDYLRNGYQAIDIMENEENLYDMNNTQQVFHEEDAAIRSAVSVLQGEDVPFDTASGFSEATEMVNRELENMQQLQVERERQIRELRHSRRRQRIHAILVSLPWRHIVRFLLIILIGVLLITAWNMRHVILNGISSLIITLLPFILLIYLLISLIRGHF